MGGQKAKVYIIKTEDRKKAISRLLEEFDKNQFLGKKVALKANFNSADPFPAATHILTLQIIIEQLKEAGISELVLAERSGMGTTRNVLDKVGVFSLSKKMGFDVVVLDEMDESGWTKIPGGDNHWLRGFYISKLFLESDKVIQTCCLKTHRFGGHFTLSLKNSVGIVAKKVPGGIYNYMGELHLSPYQRMMIAEINKYYPVDVVLMDAMKAFLNKGPESGLTAQPNLLLASNDRVAIDAVGISILRYYGTTNAVSNGKIFELDQIKRASEIGVGVDSADKINTIPLNEEATEIADEIRNILQEQG